MVIASSQLSLAMLVTLVGKAINLYLKAISMPQLLEKFSLQVIPKKDLSQSVLQPLLPLGQTSKQLIPIITP